jgi:hypothetical protein
MKSLLAAIVVMTSMGSAAIAQAYDPEIGTGNVASSGYGPLHYAYPYRAYLPYGTGYYAMSRRDVIGVGRYGAVGPGFGRRGYRIGY